MSKAVENQVNTLFEKTKNLRNPDEIKKHCEEFNQWMANNTNYSLDSLGSILSRAGLYKKFKSLELVQSENAELVETRDKNNNLKGHKLQHYAISFCGLTKKQWGERNETSRTLNRLENPEEIDPNTYLEVVEQLLQSDNPHELAVGLIAATGRRPHEILARAIFEKIANEDYHLNFEGQGKKRGDKPIFKIATLYPASYIIKRLKHLRNELKSFLNEIEKQHPNDISAQNRAIDSRRNGSLNKVVREYFGDKGESTPILKFRHGEEQDNCKALRAAYGRLVTERDCPKLPDATKSLYFAKQLGHVTGDNLSDKDLQHILTTFAYSDYYVIKPVPKPPEPMKEETTPTKLYKSDLEKLKKLQTKWKLPNQYRTLHQVLKKYELSIDQGKRIQELEEENMKLKELEKKFELLEVRIEELEKNLTFTKTDSIHEVKTTANQNLTETKTETEYDFTNLSHTELWQTKKKGAWKEKILRSFTAIRRYNDTIATGDNDRLAINGAVMRTLSGVNGVQVGNWLKDHKDEVISHNCKYEMGNSKDPSRLDTYFNKKYGSVKINELLQLISVECLDGAVII